MTDHQSTTNLRKIEDPSCPSEVLDSLSGKEMETDRLIASHSNTSAKTLRSLANSDDNETKERVAGNPNAPKYILFDWLAEYFPKAVLLNPAFDLMIFENPDLLAEIHSYALAAILRQAECPASIIEWAFTRYSKEDDFNRLILKSIVQNPAVGVSMIEKIFRLDALEGGVGSEGML